MKTYKVLLVSMVIFGLMIGGALTLLTQAQIEVASISCLPPVVALEDPIIEAFKITLTLPKGYNHEDIDPSTILVGGVVPMMEEEGWPKIKKNYFKFNVDGGSLMYWVILPEIWHMAPGPAEWVNIDITVTGELYDGTPFEGTFTLRVRTEDNDNNNGVPPP
jgi:hypothetical protein